MRLILFLAIGVTAAAQPRTTSSTYVLGANDQLKIWALGLEELFDKPVRIDPNGNLDLPLAGTVQAANLTVDQLKTKLTEKFGKELLNPKISIEVVEFGSQPVSVLGAVNQPGVHQLRGRKTVAEILSMAGGLRQDAGPRITISRQAQNGPVPLPGMRMDASGNFSVAEMQVKDLLSGKKPAENILVCPNDVVTVSTAEAVYVIGEVKKPGEVRLKDFESVSVLQALSSAEGFAQAPAPQNSKIVRIVTGTNERKEIPVDLKKIMAGQAEDIAMHANDILVVPPSGPKKAATRAMEAAIQTVTGVIIWRRP